MSNAKLALACGVAAAALVAVLWSQRDTARFEAAVPEVEVAARAAPAPLEPVRAAGAVPTAIAPAAAPKPTGVRASEAEIVEQLAERSYDQGAGVFIDHLVARGLARIDAERVIRRFFDDSLACLFDALRAQAVAESVDYDLVLNAFDADLYGSDGPLLGAVIDVGAVQDRAAPCAMTAAQQAGLEQGVLEEAARAAIRRAAP